MPVSTIFFPLKSKALPPLQKKAIKVCLEKFRLQAIYMILGMMIGSFYAIIQGPTTLEIPKAAMNLGNFQILPCVIGVALVAGMQMIKERSEKSGN